MPRARSLTHDAIADAALAVLDREGTAALSMRSVAAELGVAPMGLYRYVGGRDELESLVADRVLGAVDLRLPGRAGWATKAATLLERVRAEVARHPAVVPLLPARRHSSPIVARFAEILLGLLTEAGFTGRSRAIALRALLGYTLGAIALEHGGPLSGEGTAAFAALPADAFPLLSATAGDAGPIPVEEEFGAGLRLLLAGLEQRRPRGRGRG